jgi:hypothetical protein
VRICSGIAQGFGPGHPRHWHPRLWRAAIRPCRSKTNYVMETHYSGDALAPRPFPSDWGETTAARGAVASRNGHQTLKEI